ncbi:MAG: Crp/Fnr family transcriptional regulator [Paracoccaceae bacterium]
MLRTEQLRDMNSIWETKLKASATGWLSQTPDDFRHALLSICEVKTVDDGDVLYEQGGAPDGLWGVASGSVGVFMLAADGDQKQIHIFHPGDWAGEYPILARKEYGVTLRATGPAKVLHASQERTETMLSNSPRYWQWIGLLGVLHSGLAVQSISNLLQHKTEVRLLSVLLRLSGKTVANLVKPDQQPNEIIATQAQIGEMTNLSRTSVATILNDLVRAGLIRCEYGKIFLLDEIGILERIAE